MINMAKGVTIKYPRIGVNITYKMDSIATPITLFIFPLRGSSFFSELERYNVVSIIKIIAIICGNIRASLYSMEKLANIKYKDIKYIIMLVNIEKFFIVSLYYKRGDPPFYNIIFFPVLFSIFDQGLLRIPHTPWHP